MLDTDFKFDKVQTLAEQAAASTDKVHFKNIFENTNGGVSLLAFRQGQALAEHLAPAEVMVYVVEGEVEFTMADMKHSLRMGEFMLMGQGVAHSVAAKTDAKVMLVKVKSDK